MKFWFFTSLGAALLISSVLLLFGLLKTQHDNAVQAERAALLQSGLSKIKKIPVAEIKKSDLQPLFDAFQSGTKNRGMAIGIVFGARVFPFYFGSADKKGTPIHGETIFEIASISETYTALLLAKAVQDRRVTLDQPVESLLNLKLPQLKNGPITLRQLATHSSGLPRLPLDFTSKEQYSGSPYQNYSVERLLQSAAVASLDPAAGTYLYSPFGIALLGQALAKSYQKPFGIALQEEILLPLGLHHTWLQLPPSEEKNRVQGFYKGRAVAPWTVNAFEPSKGINTTLPDLLTYLQFMGYPDRTPFPNAIREVQKPRIKANTFMEAAFAWHLSTYRDGQITWQNGGSSGCHSFVGYWKDLPFGVAILSNSEDDFIDLIGIRLLQALKQL